MYAILGQFYSNHHVKVVAYMSVIRNNVFWTYNEQSRMTLNLPTLTTGSVRLLYVVTLVLRILTSFQRSYIWLLEPLILHHTSVLTIIPVHSVISSFLLPLPTMKTNSVKKSVVCKVRNIYRATVITVNWI